MMNGIVCMQMKLMNSSRLILHEKNNKIETSLQLFFHFKTPFGNKIGGDSEYFMFSRGFELESRCCLFYGV